MPYFQNVFPQDFEGTFLLADDRQYMPRFVCRGHSGRSFTDVVCHTPSPYDFTTSDPDGKSTKRLTIYFAHIDRKAWAFIDVDTSLAAANVSQTTAQEVVDSLNGDPQFQAWFEASVNRQLTPTGSVEVVRIRQKLSSEHFWFYIANGGAEFLMRFNYYAGVAELPTYFARHTISNRYNYDDSQNLLIQLDPAASNVDADVISNAVDARGNKLGYNPSVVRADWQLLEGKSDLFTFTIDDGNTNPNTKLIYNAGAKEGDLAMKVITTSSGNVFKIPYTLQASDLVSPP